MNTLAEALYSAITVPTQFVEANGIRFDNAPCLRTTMYRKLREIKLGA